MRDKVIERERNTVIERERESERSEEEWSFDLSRGVMLRCELHCGGIVSENND